MTNNPDGSKPERPSRRTDNQDEPGDRRDAHVTRFGVPDDPRRTFWTILVDEFRDSTDGADWNEVLDAAESNGIDRKWAHEEVKRRLRWGDVHLYQGNLYPHFKEVHRP